MADAVIHAPARVAIIGGGLGGLALAALLRLKAPQLAVTVYERGPRPADVGGGRRAQGYAIGLTQATLTLLAPLSAASPALHAVLHEPRNTHTAFRLCGPDGAPLVALSGVHATGQFVDRPALRGALLDAAGADRVRFDARLTSVAERASAVTATFADGDVITADVLVACDGANSTVRRQRFPSAVYADLGYSNVAGSLPAAAAPLRLLELASHGLVRLLGRGDGHTFMLFAYTPPDGVRRLLWSLSYPGAKAEWATRFAGAHESTDDDQDYASGAAARSELREHCAARVAARFAPEVAAAVRATPVEELFGPRQVSSLAPSTVSGLASAGPTRVRFLGDAAHATTTHMGAGANAAFADAAALADALVATPPPDWPAGAALRAYEAAMLARGRAAVDGSTRTTAVIHAAGVWARVRDAALAAVGGVAWLVGAT